MKLHFKKILPFLFLISLPLSGIAKDDVKKLEEQQKAISSTVKTLNSILKSKEGKFQDIQKTLAALKETSDDVNKEKLTKSLNSLEADFEKLELKLESIATGVPVGEYRGKDIEKFELKNEVENLLQPMIYALKSITQDSREIENLRQNLSSLEQKEDIASAAVKNLKKIISKTDENTLRVMLESMLSNWQLENDSLLDDQETLSQQLETKLESKESLLTTTGEVFTGFFKSRGVNFILGVMAFLGVFFLLRLLYFGLKKIRFKRTKYKKTSYERLADLLFTFISFIVSIVATLFVFNLRNDWLLLGLGTLFLLALGWILIKSLPNMIEQIMLLLNLGSVREGERIIYNGIPWEIKSLNFYTHFYNPVLTGGSLHISIRELMGMVSRPSAANEEWFPSKEGEWVKLENDTLGQVIYQSPEMVGIESFGGSHTTYSSESYLALNPTNLSRGYRIQMVFGIDYKYQAECTTDIPDKMRAMFIEDLIALMGEDQLVKAYTDFFQPNASSLDFEYEAFVKGSSAHLYEEVERVMIYSFANACNKYGWEIPFQQVTLHQQTK